MGGRLIHADDTESNDHVMYRAAFAGNGHTARKRAMENKKQNATLNLRDYKFIAVGDCYCNKETEQLRTYQQFFQQYGVNLIISDHNQYYEMSYPLLYNGQYEIIINKKIKPQPIVEEFHTNEENIIHNFKLYCLT